MTTGGGPDLYSSVGRVRTTDSVVEQIQQLILDNKLRVGDTLPAERDLATRLSVSRNVLREALGVLAQRGLVQSVAGRGTFVSAPSSDHMTNALVLMLRLGQVSLQELCDVRLFLEPELAARAAARMTSQADVAKLDQWMDKLEAAGAEGDAAAHVEADIGFHAQVARLAGNSVFEAIVNGVREPVVRSMMTGTTVPRAIGHSDEQHRKILAAISAGDEEEARAAMEEHMRYVAAYISDQEK
jgi:GntR family transcriptional repressor for pyruvate dehydrogenase complex